jgi:uncharacterized membrane protein
MTAIRLYPLVKYVHVLTAILALGTSAGLGILLEFYGDDAVHGAYVLRAIRRLEAAFVLPGYGLMLLTGAWMAARTWSFGPHWIQAALGLWVVGGLCLGAVLPVLGRQIAVLESSGPAGAGYRRLSLLGRALGAAGGLVVVLILYLMVYKPPLAFLP